MGCHCERSEAIWGVAIANKVAVIARRSRSNLGFWCGDYEQSGLVLSWLVCDCETVEGRRGNVGLLCTNAVIASLAKQPGLLFVLVVLQQRQVFGLLLKEGYLVESL